AYAGPHFPTLIFTNIFDSFANGMTSTALIVYTGSLCTPKYAATQYSLTNGLAALGRSILAPTAGFIAHGSGWVNFFIFSGCITLPSLIMFYIIYRKTRACT